MTLKIIALITFFLLILPLIPQGKCTDVSVRAIKVRPSSQYPLNTAWELGYTGKGIVIAFLDTGIDNEKHESLKGKFVAGAMFTPQFPPTPKDGSYDPEDINGHGTGVAHIALGKGGTTDNDHDGKPDYIGVAPDAKLIDVVVSTSIYTSLSDRYLIDAVNWCIDHKDVHWENQSPDYWGIDIINICLHSTAHPNSSGKEEVAQVINKAVKEGLVVIVAAGNEGPNNTGFCPPASADDAIVVGGVNDMGTVTREDDEIANFSSRGPRVDDGDDDPYDELKPDVVAPCCSIMAAKYDTECEYWEGYGDGTSWAAPHVAGVVALMLEANPNLTPVVVKQILHETAEQRGEIDYPDLSGKYNKSYGWGIVDAYEAVKAALAWRPPNNPPSVSITNPNNNAKVSGTITISGMASDTDGNITSIEIKIDSGNWFNISIISASSLTWSYDWDTKSVENGNHIVCARAFDGENYSTIPSVNLHVDNKEMSVAPGEEGVTIRVGILLLMILIPLVSVIVIITLLKRRR